MFLHPLKKLPKNNHYWLLCLVVRGRWLKDCWMERMTDRRKDWWNEWKMDRWTDQPMDRWMDWMDIPKDRQMDWPMENWSRLPGTDSNGIELNLTVTNDSKYCARYLDWHRWHNWFAVSSAWRCLLWAVVDWIIIFTQLSSAFLSIWIIC